MPFAALSCNRARCTECMACLNECRIEALVADQQQLCLNHVGAMCVGCGLCVRVCPEDALELSAEFCLAEPFFIPVELARDIMGKKRGLIIGISTHSLEQALLAESKGADYIGYGPVFPTSAKSGIPGIGTESFTLLNRRINIPYFAIGGINSGNISQVLEAGASRVAICSGIFSETDIAKSTRLIKQKLCLHKKIS